VALYTTLIDASTLAGLNAAVIVDCRFNLMDTARGEAAYVAGHIPGAVYAHLDRDLSNPPTTDHGRHPLPPPARLCEVFGRLGIGHGVQVVAYDDASGMMAARLWWMLRYMGHDAVAVLDGGLAAWTAAGLPLETGVRVPAPAHFTGTARHARLVQLDEVAASVAGEGGLALTDARDPARYRGEVEPIDKRAGHIPGARNHGWQGNLAADGRFLEPAALREAFTGSLGTLPGSTTVHYCGSGVTACHNVLAQVHAGLPEPRLYCGSWSEWSRDPQRPAATGAYTPIA
jgi:thiosulfate/3-mercaptopyruvate sulfurtransferase